MDTYDPDGIQDPEDWLDLDEPEALHLVGRYHRNARCDLPAGEALHLHAAIHVTVERQAALADETPVAAALSRLTRDGLTRHEAIHAVGSVLVRHMWDLQGGQAVGVADQQDRWSAAIAALTPESWLGELEEERDEAAAASHARREALAELEEDALLALLLTEEDRLPREAVDEIVARRATFTTQLIALLVDPRSWRWDPPAWWAPIHATYILGAIDDPLGDAALFSAMREAEETGRDWVTLAMPSILARRGKRVRAVLQKICGDVDEPAGVRSTCLRALAATIVEDDEGRAEVLATIARVFADPDEDEDLRADAGNILLDFRVESSRDALMAFAAEANYERIASIPFDESDVIQAFDEPANLRSYREDWLRFYDPAQIAAREDRRQHAAGNRASRDFTRRTAPIVRGPKTGRNDPCPCGSGRKYKKCCLGKDTAEPAG